MEVFFSYWKKRHDSSTEHKNFQPAYPEMYEYLVSV